jgi:Kef-type K+ transport system membrane component KefB
LLLPPLLLLLLHLAGFTAAVWPTKTPLPPSGQLYDSTVTFTVIADVGVVLFMFMLGCELDHHRYLFVICSS